MSIFEGLLASLFAVPVGTIQHYGRHFSPNFREVIYTELLRIRLSTSNEFRGIRSLHHFFRIAIMFCRFQKSVPSKLGNGERFCSCTVFRSSLQFTFGKRDVIALGVLINSLHNDERLDNRHLESACKRVIHNIEAIPFSFFSYAHPDEGCQALYLEFEGGHSEPVSTNQVLLLRKGLATLVKESIEKVVSYVHMPSNEDETLRNCILLSKEVNERDSLPQVIIQYQSQVDECLVFAVTMVRSIQIAESKRPFSSASSSVIVRSEILQVTSLEPIDDVYVKQAIILCVHVKKDPFLKCDRSIDFHQARNIVVFWLNESLGQIRDLNGGLLGQQRDVLKTVGDRMSSVPGYDMRVCENIYYSIMPPVLKSLCTPDQFVHFFKLFFQMRNTPYGRRTRVVLQVNNSTLDAYVFVKPTYVKSGSILNAAYKAGLQEHECALAFDSIEDHECYGILIISNNATAKRAFEEWVKEAMKQRWNNPSEKQKIRITLPHPPLLLDPRIGADLSSGVLIKMLYDGLFRLSENGQPIPAMAEKVEILDQGHTYVFTLRPAIWSNSLPVTAMDFEYSWKKILEPNFPTIFSYLLHPIKNAAEAKKGLVDSSEIGITSTGDQQLVVRLNHPAPYFLELCCHWMFSPLCRIVDQEQPGWAYLGGSNFVCNGPFTLAQWSPKGDIRVAKNHHYWNHNSIKLEEIEIRVIEDRLAALQQFNQGYLDWIGDPLSDIPIEDLKSANGNLYSYSVNALYWYEFNCKETLFSSKKVRKAFSLAIDRKKIASCNRCGFEKIATSILPEELSLYDDKEAYRYDVEAARRLFEEGLIDLNLSKSSIKPIQLLIPDVPTHEEITRHVIQMWHHAFGVSIVYEKKPTREFFEIVQKQKIHIAGRRWCSWYQDPFYTFEMLRSTKNTIGLCNWSSETFSNLVDRAEIENDKVKRDALFEQAERCVLEEMPIIPVVEYTYHYKKNENVRNVRTSQSGSIDFSYATVQQGSYEYEKIMAIDR